jgi:peptide/nickel transport system substrate-binding protein
MKRQLLLAGILLAVATLLFGCGPTPEPQVVEKVVTTVVKETVIVQGTPEVVEKVVEKEVVVTATPEPPQETVPRSGGQLVIGFNSTFQDTGDLHKTTSNNTIVLAENAFDTLIRQHPDTGEYYPGLAKSWEISEDGKSVTLHLRDDVTFHDGTPFNAEAVRYNLNRIATLPEAKGRYAYGKLGVDGYFDSVEVLDEYTVKVNFKKVFAPMISALSDCSVGCMHSPTAIEKYGDAYGTDYLVGTGPFKFVKWTGEVGELTFVRNEDYNWGGEFYKHQGPAYLDGFTVKGIVEDGTRLAALEAGDLDVSLITAKDVARFKESPGFKAVVMPSKGTGGLQINLNNPILADVRVRRALSYAIDREAMLQTPRYSGYGDVMYSWYSPALWGTNEEEFKQYNYLYDPEKAKALLEEVGWKDEDGDGVREAHGVEGIADGTKLHLLNQVRPRDQEDDFVTQQMFAAVGIEVELEIHDFAAREALLFDRQFDIAGWPGNASNLYAIQEEVPCGSQYNIGDYCNPKVDEWIAKAFATSDPEEQRADFAQAMILMLPDVHFIPIVRGTWPWAMKAEVMDLTTTAYKTGLYLYDAWLNE